MRSGDARSVLGGSSCRWVECTHSARAGPDAPGRTCGDRACGPGVTGPHVRSWTCSIRLCGLDRMCGPPNHTCGQSHYLAISTRDTRAVRPHSAARWDHTCGCAAPRSAGSGAAHMWSPGTNHVVPRPLPRVRQRCAKSVPKVRQKAKVLPGPARPGNLASRSGFRFPHAMVAPARPQSAPLAAPWTPALEGDSEIWLRAPVSGSRMLW